MWPFHGGSGLKRLPFHEEVVLEEGVFARDDTSLQTMDIVFEGDRIPDALGATHTGASARSRTREAARAATTAGFKLRVFRETARLEEGYPSSVPFINDALQYPIELVYDGRSFVGKYDVYNNTELGTGQGFVDPSSER